MSSKTNARSEDQPAYVVAPTARSTKEEDVIIAQALSILSMRLRREASLDSPATVKQFLRLQIGALDHEVFGLIFLDAQHRVIEFEVMFRGTLTQTSVYPREVVKAALQHNAAAVILAHNHPSGVVEPSRADEYLTATLKQALALVDVRVLDHIIVSPASETSFAERGLL